MRSSYWPFGSFLFCSEDGAVCVENATAVVRMLYLVFTTGSADSSIEDHLKYGDVIGRVSQQFLIGRSFTQGVIPKSCYEVGISVALEASGIAGQVQWGHERVQEEEELLANALAVLNEDRFLAPRGWSFS
ncbi:hypothetical protein HHK36_000326 [Tetracentron sinense]|uniref:Uncharacterized protein n=1 Tax=Tetracentron sinense TaxID=13715 RepID=A0A834ZTX3_TETSI|nr:hypothetical protein HHK36_000326 [Tetracentron sinense]